MNENLRNVLLALIGLLVIPAVALWSSLTDKDPSQDTPASGLTAAQISRVQENSLTWASVPNYLDHFDALAVESRSAGSLQNLPLDAYWGLPEDPAGTFDLVGMYCGGCHSLDVVTQQRATRARWQALLDWMVAEQGMVALEADDQRAILDYLVANFGA